MRYTVLIVEDLETCREPIAAVLRAAGYTVICAENARRAITLIEENTPDVLLVDLALPGMSGLELLQHLRQTEQYRQLPAVIFSGSGDVSIGTEGLGIAAWLVKSQASTADIRAAIAKAVERA